MKISVLHSAFFVEVSPAGTTMCISCMHVHVHVYMDACMHACIHAIVNVCTNLQHMHTNIHTYVKTDKCTSVHNITCSSRRHEMLNHRAKLGAGRSQQSSVRRQLGAAFAHQMHICQHSFTPHRLWTEERGGGERRGGHQWVGVKEGRSGQSKIERQMRRSHQCTIKRQ